MINCYVRIITPFKADTVNSLLGIHQWTFKSIILLGPPSFTNIYAHPWCLNSDLILGRNLPYFMWRSFWNTPTLLTHKGLNSWHSSAKSFVSGICILDFKKLFLPSHLILIARNIWYLWETRTTWKLSLSTYMSFYSFMNNMKIITQIDILGIGVAVQHVKPHHFDY